ncbi:related to putative arabinase [Melanopsichium pennsylvanicum]|uniref:Related to putative arabinase n=2 Tax=Melanopsichium pennsylvanicum TaxID=63383 RepID=A0AAJ5C5T8_9BASI|nr:carbon source-regulated protein (putative arabinase) [Melanopsichium pennsylvanicum 4]SNX85112.1 related to putative arabinase [Melanopsichium pennsylvanicum]
MTSFSLIAVFLSLFLGAVYSLPSSSFLTRSTDSHSGGADGYFAVTFKTTEEKIFGHVAKVGEETTFTAVNQGKPLLVASKGTRGVRDPFVVASPTHDRFWIIGTDLNASAINQNFTEARHYGSTSLHIWESTDLVNWSGDNLVQVMPDSLQAGMVWAPSAVYDHSIDQFSVFWASKTFPADDPGHLTNGSLDQIWYAHTKDFRNFTMPRVWASSDVGLIDQEILTTSDKNTFYRFLKDENVTEVYAEKTTTGLFGEWHRLGKTVVQGRREGPASYRDIRNPSRTYLWVDNYNATIPGYEAYYSDDIDSNVWTPTSPSLTPATMRHGAIIPVTKRQMHRLMKWR